LNVEQKISFLIDKSHLKTDDKTMQTFEHLISLSKEFGSDITSFFKTIALESDTDTYDYNAEKVVLMSMHAAKGLEFPVVFIAGCEDDYMPFRKSPDAAPDLNEERRLLYVAMTRARELLYLTYAKKRVIYGKRVAREISPFVKDIERRLLKGKSSCFEHKKEKQTQIQLF
jgi:superfamily I DNA/RNA helicase